LPNFIRICKLYPKKLQKMRTINLLATFASILVVMFMGCKNDNFVEIVGVCPEVILTVPADEAVGVPLNQIITANFNTSMNPLTINETTFLVYSGTNKISGAVTYSGTSATFTPASPLIADTEYTGSITSASKNPFGNRLMGDHTWSFSTVSRHSVTLSSNPSAGGTTSGGGTFDPGKSVTVSATANQGYTFTNWTEGTTIVSTNANYPFSITKDRVLVANFTEAAAPKFNVSLSGNPANGGTTSGGGTFDSGTSVTVSATANQGYTFTNWTEGATIVSTNANYTFSITKDRVLVANFTEAATPKFNVSLSGNPANGGTTSGGGTFDTGTSVTVSATANQGYTFTYWTEGATIVSTNANYTFSITKDRVLVANFTEAAPGGVAAINLGSAGDFSILAKSGISTTGNTSVQGDIGISPAASSALTGFGLIMNASGKWSNTTVSNLVTGKVYASDYAPPTPGMLTAAISDMETAYNTASNLVTPAPIMEAGAGNISGMTLAPGLYKWSTGVLIDSDASVTLSGGPNDQWIFIIAQDLTLMTEAEVKLSGSARAKNIIWVVAGKAVLGNESELYGTILSKTLISLNAESKVTGRLLAQTSVTLNTSKVIKP
jgi:hypothetical protein